MDLQHFIALTRFGFGVKANSDWRLEASAKTNLKQHLTPVAISDISISSEQVLRDERLFRQLKKQIKTATEANNKNSLQQQLQNLRKSANRAHRNYIRNVIEQSVADDVGLNWRLLDFFSNHFSVSANNRVMKGLAPALEAEAIAPNLYGSFADMLLAISQHPAMLLYLNNERSIGPNSKVGKRKVNTGINENLAREILELHTLGVKANYTQADVIEFAKALTGWSLAPEKSKKLGFIFNERFHEPGKRTILDKTFSQRGIAKGEAILRYLASRPETAYFLCTKLAKHFISDTPSPQLLDKMQAAWLASDGNIKTTIEAMIDAPESWQPEQSKFKTPREFLISSLRASAVPLPKQLQPYYSLRELGQLPFNAGSPAGYKDSEADWLSPSSMLNRVDWSSQFATIWQSRVTAVPDMLEQLFGPHIGELSAKSILRAESKSQALTLLLMAPEFQRR